MYNINHEIEPGDFSHKKHRPNLDKFGVRLFAVFGSVARGEAKAESDVDILVEFEGLATFDRFMVTKYYLQEILGCRVGLVVPDALKPRMKPAIMQELVYVT